MTERGVQVIDSTRRRDLTRILAAPVVVLGLACVWLWCPLNETALAVLIFAFMFIGEPILCRGSLNRREQVALAKLDVETLQPAPEGERYVGVAYCQLGKSWVPEMPWDRGFLSVCEGALVFRGQLTSFRLPLASVTKAYAPLLAAPHTLNRRRVYVDWEHPTEGMRGMSLQPLDLGPLDTQQAWANALAEWIREAKEGAGAVAAGDAQFPPLLTKQEFRKLTGEGRWALLDLLLRLLALAVAIGLLVAAWRYLGPRMNLGGVLLCVAVMSWCSEVYGQWATLTLRRIRARRRAESLRAAREGE